MYKAAVELLEKIELTPPGPRALELIEKFRYKRSVALAYLEVVDKKCCWCNVNDIKPPKRRYCSTNCVSSGWFYANPQDPKCKMWLFINRQNCICYGCGEDFQEEVAQRIIKKREHYDRMKKNYPTENAYWEGPVPYHAIGDNTGHIWQVDHIIPMFKGGHGLDLNNIQVLCVPCHKRKSALERRF
jgi:hypothetical protein